MEWPSVTLVYVAFNRREVLRTAVSKTLLESDYPGELDAIVIDNASSDGTAEMVRTEFPQVHLIAREENIGAPAWNEGFETARGDFVVILDDDCYLPPDGLTRAIAAAQEHDADLVSFKVVSTHDPSYVWTEESPAGLLSFWGCAAVVRREVLLDLGGYDTEIFIWGNEMELTLRLYDRGYRHLHLPGVVAQHMKELPDLDRVEGDSPAYRLHARNYAYIAGKLLRGRDSVAALSAHLIRRLIASTIRGPGPLDVIRQCIGGYFHGLRHRAPVRPALSRFYRANCETYRSPMSLMPSPLDVVAALRGGRGGTAAALRSRATRRRAAFYEARAQVFPDEPRALSFEVGSRSGDAGEQQRGPAAVGESAALDERGEGGDDLVGLVLQQPGEDRDPRPFDRRGR